MFFELLMLLIDTKMHHFTEGEPWKILILKLILIPFLFPIHHWIEKTFVNLLLNKKLTNFFKNLNLKKYFQSSSTEESSV